MDFKHIISHMNDHHEANLHDLCKKFGGVGSVKQAKLVGVDFDGLDITYNDNENLRVPFPKRADEASIKDIIIELCMGAKAQENFSVIAKEVHEFMRSFNSVCIASLNSNKEVVCSYAPFVSTQWGNYIYISEVSEHFANIKEHPDNIEIMFLEDESKAVSVILRKRLRYRVKASFIERGEIFDRIYDEFEKQRGGDSKVKTIRKMLDFHLVRLEFQKARFVKGFGQAYDIENESIQHVTTNPHKFAHKH